MANFRNVMADITGDQNPFDNESDREENGLPAPQEPDQDVEPKNPTLHALWLLRQADGINLGQLVNNVLFRDTEISGDKHVVAARTAIYELALTNGVKRVYKPPHGIRIRGKAHRQVREDLKAWALEIATEVLKLELSDYAATTRAQDTEIEVVSEESLKKLTFDVIADNVALQSGLDACLGCL
ncbi:hypothetical protein RSOL_056140, partial [Rhizoctonia solani AG-3 Rhs1AP]